MYIYRYVYIHVTKQAGCTKKRRQTLQRKVERKVIMGRTPCCVGHSAQKRGPWMAEEDQKLINYLQHHGCTKWRTLPKLAGINLLYCNSLSFLFDFSEYLGLWSFVGGTDELTGDFSVRCEYCRFIEMWKKL